MPAAFASVDTNASSSSPEAIVENAGVAMLEAEADERPETITSVAIAPHADPGRADPASTCNSPPKTVAVTTGRRQRIGGGQG